MKSPMTTSQRICFQLQVKPELLAEYVERHTPVRPEMLAEIAASGRRNYSLYLAEGGRLIGYYETYDDDAAQAYLAASEVAAAWEAEMSPFFVGLDGRPDQGATALTEIFHLEDQLAEASVRGERQRGEAPVLSERSRGEASAVSPSDPAPLHEESDTP